MRKLAKLKMKLRLFKAGAADKINKIAIDTSSELIQKLIGAEVNNSSISAIVDDLSKRSGDKYYGN
jgi:F-type H+-transporting ATPase subunit b